MLVNLVQAFLRLYIGTSFFSQHKMYFKKGSFMNLFWAVNLFKIIRNSKGGSIFCVFCYALVSYNLTHDKHLIESVFDLT